MNRSFGRYYVPDKRDHNYDRKYSVSKYKYWKDRSPVLDQGDEPSCVGHAWAHWLSSPPFNQFVNPTGIYDLAKCIDEWDGEDYEGTSVRAGAKVLHHLGFIEKYTWGDNLEDLVNMVLTTGPVVVGTYWLGNMYETDKNGFIHASGRDYGGHAYLINGVNTKDEKFRLKNSWGSSWGEKGFAYISFDDMSRLIKDDGDMCLAIEKCPK